MLAMSRYGYTALLAFPEEITKQYTVLFEFFISVFKVSSGTNKTFGLSDFEVNQDEPKLEKQNSYFLKFD